MSLKQGHEMKDRIWNMDETGMVLEHRPTKVLARRGARYLQSRISGNQESVTVNAAANAAGKALPPHLIVKGKTRLVLNGFDSDKAPEGTVMSVSDSGWTKQGIGALWFTDVFLRNIGPERPQLLVMDGHDSHCFVELIEKAMEENKNIILVELPSHTSHWLQPLDCMVFFSLKTHYNAARQQFLNDWPNLTISHRNFCGLLAQAGRKALTKENIVRGFESTGIMPFNTKKILQEAFIPSMLYIELPVTENNNEPATAGLHTLTNSIPVVEVIAEEVPAVSEVSSFHDNLGYSVVEDHVSGEQAECGMEKQNVCPPDLALSAVELSIGPDTVENFKQHYTNGGDASLETHCIYQTWKQYKILLDHKDKTQADTNHTAVRPTFPFSNSSSPDDDDNDILPYPQLQKAKSTSHKGKHGPQYFVLTAKEVYESKLAYILKLRKRRRKTWRSGRELMRWPNSQKLKAVQRNL